MTEAVPGGGVRFQENINRVIGKVEFGDEVFKDGQGGQ